MSSPVKFSFAYSEMPMRSPTEMSMPSPSEWMSSSSKKSAASMMSSPASKISSATPKKSSFAAEMSSSTSSMPPPLDTPIKKSPAAGAEMSSPTTKSMRTSTASVDSKCTTFSDIIEALDETHDRIASMGIDDIKQDRIDSMHSLSEVDKARMSYHRAFDTKKYMKDYKNGDITLLQIQVAANAIKLPEEHRADWIAVNGSECFCSFDMFLTMLTDDAQSFLSPLVVTASAPTTLTLALPSADATPSPTTSMVPSRRSRTSLASEAKRLVSCVVLTCHGRDY